MEPKYELDLIFSYWVRTEADKRPPLKIVSVDLKTKTITAS